MGKRRFVGGPYDGMEIEGGLIEQHVQLLHLTGDVGTRRFVFMPPREEWERWARGEKTDSPVLYPYQLHDDEEGLWYSASSPEAVDRARSESRLKLHSRARMALSVLAPSLRRQFIEAVDALQHEEPERWPRDRVVRLPGDEPLYLLRVSPVWRAFVLVHEGGQLELSDIVHQDTLRLFGERQHGAEVTG